MAVDKDLMVLIKSNQLGDGEPDLGEKLMKAFLNMLLEPEAAPDIIIFMNSGVFLTTQGSPLLDTLKSFAEKGTKIYSCGTCLDYYNRKDKLEIGEPGNMRDTVNAMLSHKQILAP